jgi:hypothetical protein
MGRSFQSITHVCPGPRNLSYLRSSNYRDSRQTTLSIEEYLQSSEEEEEEPTEHDDYDSGSRSIDKKVTVPFVSIWPGYTPFTFDFPTPGILAMRYTAENERKVEQIPIDDGRNETLQWDHLIHTPKMAVIDFGEFSPTDSRVGQLGILQK